MKDIQIHKSTNHIGAVPFSLAQATTIPLRSHNQLAGFAKVLVGGRVESLDNNKSFGDRMLAEGVSQITGKRAPELPTVEHVILESVATNLEAGVKLLDKQEYALAKMGGRLSEMALCLNQARSGVEYHKSAQDKFEEARLSFRSLAKETFDHTALFSNGPAKPITVVVPTRSRWEGLSIDRANINSPAFVAIDGGKVSPNTDGLLLDPQTFSQAFKEWRNLCATNRLQWHLVYQRWQWVVSTLKHYLGGRRWTTPPLPGDPGSNQLRRPHLNN
jgi:hypothetical protein